MKILPCAVTGHLKRIFRYRKRLDPLIGSKLDKQKIEFVGVVAKDKAIGAGGVKFDPRPIKWDTVAKAGRCCDVSVLPSR